MFDRTRLRLKFLQFARTPTNTELIFDMVALANKLPENQSALEAVERRARSDADFKTLWQSRWQAPVYTLQFLANLPERSLGRVYYEHLMQNRLDLNFYRQPKIHRLSDYIALRLYQTHDLWHVLLDYDVSPEGEVAIQAFTLAQLGSPISTLLMAAGFIHSLERTPEQSEDLFAAAVDGYRRGKNVPFLLKYKLEEQLEDSLEDVRTTVGLETQSPRNNVILPAECDANGKTGR